VYKRPIVLIGAASAAFLAAGILTAGSAVAGTGTSSSIANVPGLATNVTSGKLPATVSGVSGGLKGATSGLRQGLGAVTGKAGSPLSGVTGLLGGAGVASLPGLPLG
jgi:hypothetical protein